MDREFNKGIIGYIIYTDKSLREKEESKIQNKKGFPIGIYSTYALQASCI